MYGQIKVKKEVLDVLKKAADDISKTDGRKVTVASLVGMLADAYQYGMSPVTLAGNHVSWIASGYPVILNSDSFKHYQELMHYRPTTCVLEVNNFIRGEAMKERFARAVADLGGAV